MPVLHDWNLELDVDHILSGQGANPAAIRERHPGLVAVAGRALSEGAPLLRPLVAYRQLAVESLGHQRLRLEGGGALSGTLVVKHLAAAQQVVAILCTIGPLLENHIAHTASTEPAYGLALDGLGSAAIVALANAACRHFGERAASAGLQATLPLSPGMEGWPTGQGQAEIFRLVDPQEAGVRLTPSGMMIPLKSLSMVIGIGEKVSGEANVCDYCQQREICRYRERGDAHS